MLKKERKCYTLSCDFCKKIISRESADRPEDWSTAIKVLYDQGITGFTELISKDQCPDCTRSGRARKIGYRVTKSGDTVIT